MAGVLTLMVTFAPPPRLSWQGAKAEFVLAWPHQTGTGTPIVVTSDKGVCIIVLERQRFIRTARLMMERTGRRSHQ